MEIKYQNAPDDYRTSFDAINAGTKKRQRDGHRRTIAWYLSFMALGVYVSMKHEEYFITCLFVTLVLFFLWRNWSFERLWSERAEQYVDTTRNESCALELNDEGLIDTSSDVILKVPWSRVEGFNIHPTHLFIRFDSKRTICIPLRYLESGQREQLIAILEDHNIPKRLK